jgi:iron complex outermembrane receptor protein
MVGSRNRAEEGTVTRRLVILAAFANAWPAAHAADDSLRNLKALSVDQLLDLEVTSVAKRSTPLADAAASIYVITAEAIRRSSASTLAEALRLAPSLQVAQIDSVQYAISARGFNNAVGNKLLVLVDGRTIYTPLYSGVFWDQQDLLMEDIERIEVISGPGASLWGVNAVNGVINVITRNAQDTTGTLLSGSAGGHSRGGAVRYGHAFGSGAWRAYAKYAQFDHTTRSGNIDQQDDWKRMAAGFRTDWSAGEANGFTLQGDVYKGDADPRGTFGPIVLTEVAVEGANLLGRWRHTAQDGGELQLQLYFDHSERDDALFFRPRNDIADLDLQYAVPGKRHRVLWGAGYRYAHDDIEPGFATIFVPASRSLGWGNLFVQDEVALTDSMTATLGLKLEYNDYTDVEVLPSVRLAWKPREGYLLWSSLSRAVRAPARYDRDVRFPGFPPFFVVGGPNFESEVANVVELGMRAQPGETVSYSVTAFAHFWDKLRSGTAIPVELENRIEGTISGVEAWAEYKPLDFWVLSAGVTWLDEDLRLEEGSTDPVGVDNPTLRNDPHYFGSLRSRFDLPRNVQVDLDFRRVGALSEPALEAYSELNVRVAWLPTDSLEFAILGRNLLHDRHSEFGDAVSRSSIERDVVGEVRWLF